MNIKGKKVKSEMTMTYKGAWIVDDKLPTLKHVPDGCVVEAAEIVKLVVLEDGREVQTLRVVINAEGVK